MQCDNLFADPSGRLVAVSSAPDEVSPLFPQDLLDVETGKPVGLKCSTLALGVGARCGLRPADLLYRGFALWEQGRDGPVVALTGDGEPSYYPQFSPDGLLAAWGNSDGSVTLCDLRRIEAQLRKIGLGW